MSSSEPWPGARYDGPIPETNYSLDGAEPIIGLQVHHVDGPLAAASGRFHTPGAEASAHYGVDFDGSALWWVHPRMVAYAGCRANWTGYISVENASHVDAPDAPPTTEQVRTMAAIASWHGIHPQPVAQLGGAGIGYHRQFPGPCESTWGQTDCPGDGFVAAIPAIIAAMSPIPPPPVEDSMKAILAKLPDDPTVWVCYRDSGLRTHLLNNNVRQALVSDGVLDPAPVTQPRTTDNVAVRAADWFAAFGVAP